MNANSDPCDSAELKAQQKERLREIANAGKAIGEFLFTTGIAIAAGAAMLGAAAWIGPERFVLICSVPLFIATLAWAFHPSIKLVYCLLQERLKGSRPK